MHDLQDSENQVQEVATCLQFLCNQFILTAIIFIVIL